VLQLNLVITEEIEEKLWEKHDLDADEVEEVWKRENPPFTLIDTREEHKTNSDRRRRDKCKVRSFEVSVFG
jgi:hypothetical protein